MRDSKGRSPERIVLLSHMLKAPCRGVRSHAQASAVRGKARRCPVVERFGTHKPVKARLWPLLEPFLVPKSPKLFNLFLFRSAAARTYDCNPARRQTLDLTAVSIMMNTGWVHLFDHCNQMLFYNV